MSGLLIVADDLSGALDTGVQFCAVGFSVEVYPFYEKAQNVSGKTAGGTAAGENLVRVINTASRHLKPEEARRRILSLKSLIRASSVVYKKTDSTLRGHIGAELEAFMEARNISVLPFIPAYPELGRIVREGRAFINGTPLDMSSMARDPLNPVKTAKIAEIINEESSVPAGAASADGRFDTRGTNIIDAEKRIIIFDSCSAEEIDRIGILLENEAMLGAAAGSAGFARVLAEKFAPSGAAPDRAGGKNTFAVNKNLPLLIISGSLNPVSAEQIAFARKGGIPGIELSSSVLAGYAGNAHAQSLSRESEKAARFLAGGKALILSVSGDLPSGVPSAELARTPAEGLANFAAALIKKSGPLNLAVSGGDTLLALAAALDCETIKPRGEIENGVVLSEAGTLPGSLVTKSGAFGNRETLLNIVSFFGKIASGVPARGLT